jgi:hypothetical protein
MPTTPFYLADSYRTLGLSPFETYTDVQMRKAYLKRARQTHPDTNRRDPRATQIFQHVSRCYETVQLHQNMMSGARSAGKEANPQAEDDANIDIDDFRLAYERLMCKLSVFWNTSTEAKLVKQLWRSFCERAENDAQQEARTGHHDDDEAEPQPSSDISYFLRIPIADVYRKEPQKLSFYRKRWDAQGERLKEEQASLLVNTGYKKTTFYGEGHHCWSGGGYDGCGDVTVTIEPVMDNTKLYRVADDGVLHRQFAVEQEDWFGRPFVIDLFGDECFFVVPDIWKADEPTTVVVSRMGLYDTDTMNRCELHIDCVHPSCVKRRNLVTNNK